MSLRPSCASRVGRSQHGVGAFFIHLVIEMADNLYHRVIAYVPTHFPESSEALLCVHEGT